MSMLNIMAEFTKNWKAENIDKLKSKWVETARE